MSNLKKFLKEVIFCLLVLLQVSGAWSGSRARIVNGDITQIEKVPFAVQIFFHGDFRCAGTLVATDAVVTAASCVHKYAPSTLMVKGGANTVVGSGILSSVSKVLLPKAFNEKTYNMDVAVLKLNTPLNGTNIETIGLCKKSSFEDGDVATIYGWGNPALYGYNSNELRTAELKVVNNKECEESYAFTFEITETMFCASSPNKTTCFSDDGGPVMIDDQFCGIISGIAGCFSENVIPAFTSIPKVLNFIQKALLK